MTILRQLVERYVSGVVQFPEFRRAFVTEFLAVASQDPAVWSAVLQIESECDDFAEGLINEEQLKLNLPAKLSPVSSMSVLQILTGTDPLSPIAGTSTVPPRAVGTAGQLVGADGTAILRAGRGDAAVREYSFDPINGLLRVGPTMLLLDPFTPNERIVPEDSPEGQAWLAAHPPTGRTLTVVKIDHETKTVTLA